MHLCVELDGQGNWNSDGCMLISFDDSTGIVECQCTHLTNFACLVVSKFSLPIFLARVDMDFR